MKELCYSVSKMFVPANTTNKIFTPNIEDLGMYYGKEKAEVHFVLRNAVAFCNVSVFSLTNDGKDRLPVVCASDNSKDRVFSVAFCSDGRDFTAGMVSAVFQNVAMQICNYCLKFGVDNGSRIVIDDNGVHDVFDLLTACLPADCDVWVHEWSYGRVFQVRHNNEYNNKECKKLKANCEMYSLMFESTPRRRDRIYCASFCYYVLDSENERHYICNHYGDKLEVNVDVDNTKLDLSFAEAILDIGVITETLEKAMDGKFIANEEFGNFYVERESDYYPSSFKSAGFEGNIAMYSNDGFSKEF